MPQLPSFPAVPKRFLARKRAEAAPEAKIAVRAFVGGNEIDIYGDIGPNGISAAAFRQSLAQADAGDIVLRINSTGGDIFDGLAIYNDLVASGRNVIVRITGVAGSAASVIAMAGTRIEIAPNAHFMIHNAWCMDCGNAKELRETAVLLEQIDAGMAETYAARTGLGVDEIRAMMDRETWLSASDAVQKKFCDALMPGVSPRASAPQAPSPRQSRRSSDEDASAVAEFARQIRSNAARLRGMTRGGANARSN
ncbi:head maturation protease, ClpP-related [Rhodomicrobium lacus]|uniref:head maturation protease, ClpP-related n=1 Tax=Rhodomicrobium lacus TaxID=2498452 RepID=UPI000F8D1652|nr:head maturation protease, ClpP-related [Rhodomicrobium lacus]